MQVAAIFGVGGRVGKSVALKFLQNGYQVAAVSRSGATSLDDEVVKYKDTLRQYRADLKSSEEVVRVWKEIQNDFASPVSVVFYNAAVNSGSALVLDIPAEKIREDMEINTLSVYTLAQQAIHGFEKLPSSTPKAFIYTGNGLDDPAAFPRTSPNMFTLALGKAATARLIDAAAQAYGSQGYKFYYIDERLASEAPAYSKITGEGHADISWELSQGDIQGDWRVRFINGKGRI